MDNGESRYMTFNKKDFRKLQEQEVNIQVELGNNAKYLVTRIGYVSFHMPSSDVLELNDVCMSLI